MKYNPLHNLINAIIVQAVTDYRRAKGGEMVDNKPPERTIKEIKNFFLSDWFLMLTEVKGEILIEKLRKEFPNDK